MEGVPDGTSRHARERRRRAEARGQNFRHVQHATAARITAAVAVARDCHAEVRRRGERHARWRGERGVPAPRQGAGHALAPELAGGARHGGGDRRRRSRAVLRRLPVDRGPGARRLLPGGDHQRLLRRRGDPHGVLRGVRPHLGGLRDAPAARGSRRRRVRGPHLLRERGHRPARHRPRPVEQPAWPAHPGWVDDHPAVRRAVLRRDHHLLHREVQGGHPRDQDRQPAGQGGDPRELPQHDLLRARLVRHRGGGAELLRQARERTHGLGVGAAGRRHPLTLQLRPGRGPGDGGTAVEPCARPDGGGRVDHPG